MCACACERGCVCDLRVCCARAHVAMGAQFKELQKAYEVLNDPEKKSLYDRFGEKGVEQGGGGGGGGQV